MLRAVDVLGVSSIDDSSCLCRLTHVLFMPKWWIVVAIDLLQTIRDLA